MPPTSIFSAVEDLSPAALTVRAQARSVLNPGNLYWRGFFPRVDAPSVRLEDMMTLDFRPVADRREWNQEGRHVRPRAPERRRIDIVPVEAYDKIGEYEMQLLNERFNGNAGAVIEEMQATIPGRVDLLTDSVDRRIELDAFSAWLTGTIVQRNPQNAAETQTASFDFDAARIATASPAWDNTTAYDEFLAWYEDGMEEVGAGAGAATRLAVVRAIQASAPDLMGGVTMTRAQLEQRISDDLGAPFRFFIIEDTVDLYSDGGMTTAGTKVFTAGRLAYVPADGRVGRTAAAPVVRAMELASVAPQAGIDRRGVTIYYDEERAGKGLTIQAQSNHLSIPDEQRVWVINTGVV